MSRNFHAGDGGRGDAGALERYQGGGDRRHRNRKTNVDVLTRPPSPVKQIQRPREAVLPVLSADIGYFRVKRR